MRTYTVIPTKKQVKIMKKHWKALQQAKDELHNEIQKIKKRMIKETKIKDIEFFMSDGAYIGIGNTSRTMSLIQWDVLKK